MYFNVILTTENCLYFTQLLLHTEECSTHDQSVGCLMFFFMLNCNSYYHFAVAINTYVCTINTQNLVENWIFICPHTCF